VKERIERVSRLATVAGPPSGTVGDGALCDALEAEQAHLPEPGVDVGQDVDGLGHLGERVAARVERVDHGDHDVGSPWDATGMKKTPKADASEPVTDWI
jgi:hypothetical protein